MPTTYPCGNTEAHIGHKWRGAAGEHYFCNGLKEPFMPNTPESAVNVTPGRLLTVPHDEQPRDRAKRVLEELSVEPSAENLSQMCAYLEAFEIFLERNKRHKAGWRVAGLPGILVDIRKKCERLWNEFMLSEPGQKPDDVDSALDLINYTAFFVQAHHEERDTGRAVGDWRWNR